MQRTSTQCIMLIKLVSINFVGQRHCDILDYLPWSQKINISIYVPSQRKKEATYSYIWVQFDTKRGKGKLTVPRHNLPLCGHVQIEPSPGSARNVSSVQRTWMIACILPE